MNESTAPIVVALGGNAISPAGESDTIERQFRSTRTTARALVDLMETGAPVVITHGNGPQVGQAVRRVELAAPTVYPLPLHICVADLQGGMGFMIAQCLNNELRSRGIDRTVSAIVTTVEVDADDPAFADPTKPIGPYFDADAAADLRRERGWDMIEVPNQGMRRVVPSPRPKAIGEIGLMRRLVESGETIIAVGGGGIPVVRDAAGDLRGCDAVIDKDRASGLLALELGAATLLIVTGVERVCVDFGTDRQRALEHLTAEEARRLHEDGQFPKGSMGPKIEVAIDFVERSPHPNARVIITDIEHTADALAGRAGTLLTRAGVAVGGEH